MVQSSKYRIGYILQNGVPDLDKPSGPQVHVVRIIESLQELGHHVRTVRLDRARQRMYWSDDLLQWQELSFRGAGRREVRVLGSGIRHMQTALKLPYLNYFDSRSFAAAAATVLRDRHFLFERFGFMGYGGVLLSRQLNIPLLLEVNGNPFDEINHLAEPLPPVQQLISKRITRFTLGSATKVLPSGYGWCKRLRETELLTHDRVQVVWPGTDDERFSLQQDKAEIFHRYGIGSGPVISFIGGFYPWQGISTLLDAFQSIANSVSNATLVFGGDGPLLDEMKSKVRKLDCSDRIRFLGRLSSDQIAEILAVTNVGVLLIEQHAEFVGMKLFDYMASGVAIIVTAPNRHHDLIIHGETGYVIEPANVDQLSEALQLLCANESYASRLGGNARAAMPEHTWLQRAREIEALGHQVLNETRIQPNADN